MKDYAPIVELAESLINKYGRAIIFIRKSSVPSDPLRPWIGPAENTDIQLTLSAVAVPPSQIRQFGLTALSQGTEYFDLVTFSEQIFIVSPKENDLRDYTNILDENVQWGIVGIQTLRPANLNLLSYVGVRR